MDHPDQSQKQIDQLNPRREREVNRVLPHRLALKSMLLLLVFLLGAASGYLFGEKIIHSNSAMGTPADEMDVNSLMNQVLPPEGYKIPAIFANTGPQLLASGAIDLSAFINLYQQQNKPLTNAQLDILTKESVSQVEINRDNAYFLLNYFWALGLTNQNSILTEGPMLTGGYDKVGNFASTGGWTLGAKKVMDLYASTQILNLTTDQQARLVEVASGVYRPCCNNPTHFPDCNHGMAMLGLLELMASQDASSQAMFEAAKYVTAFWYPQQMMEIATALQATQGVDYVQADARTIVSRQYASISGFQSVHQWLSQNGLLRQSPGSESSCGVQ